MRTQIRGLNQGSRNTQDGISLIQTAEGAYHQVSFMLQRMRELAVQSTNGTNETMDREALDLEFQNLKSEIDQIAQLTNFNGKILLDGRYARATGAASFAAALSTLDSDIIMPSNFIPEPMGAASPVALLTPLMSTTQPAPDYTIAFNTLVDGDGVPGEWSFSGGVLTVHSNSTFRINGTGVATDNRIVVESVTAGTPVNIILSNVNIRTDTGPAMQMHATEVDLWVSGNNTLITTLRSRAGIETSATSTLRINAEDDLQRLNVTGGPSEGVGAGAGIGGAGAGSPLNPNAGPGGNIYIYGGRINATGGPGAGVFSGAGIGGGGNVAYHSAGNVTIRGGVVTAIGGTRVPPSSSGYDPHDIRGAGIGGGNQGGGANLTIEGGLLEVFGRAWIGPGSDYTGSNVGTVTITGGHLSTNNVVLENNPTPPPATRPRLSNPGDPQSHIASTPPAIRSTITDNLQRVRVMLYNGDDVTFGTFEAFPVLTEISINIDGVPTTSMTDSMGRLFLYLPQGAEVTVGWHNGTEYLEGKIESVGNNQHLNRIVLTSSSFNPTPVEEADWRRMWLHSDAPGGVIATFENPTIAGDVERTNASTATANFSSNKVGVFRYLIRGPGEPTPNDEDIALNGILSTSAGNSYSVDFDGLSSGAYRLYVLIEDEDGHISEILRLNIPPYVDLTPTEWGPLWIQSGANEGDGLYLHIESLRVADLGILDDHIRTQEAASASITAMTIAINMVSLQRADLGAYQNRLEYTKAHVDNTSENIAAAESRIRDTDIAKKMTQLTKEQILIQASTAMLAQANAIPQSVLQLLE
jgi:flagellin